MSEPVPWRGLHPASPLINLLPRLWGIVTAYWPLLFAVYLGNARRPETAVALFDLAIVGVVFLLGLMGSLIHALTLRWRVVDGRLEVRSGWFSLQERAISRDRVQNVEIVQGPLLRLAGLVDVRIDTASGTEVEGLLSALSHADAQMLVAALRPAASAPTAAPPPEETVTSAGPVELLVQGALSPGGGALAVIAGLTLDLWGPQPGDPAIGVDRALFSGVRGLAILAAMVSAGWLLGVARVFVRHWGFRIVRQAGRLTAEEGLFTRRKVELPPERVQIASVTQTWLRRRLGVVWLQLETAAARTEAGGIERAQVGAPIPQADAGRVLRAAMPGIDLDPFGPLAPPAQLALRRELVSTSLFWVVVTGVSVGALGAWGAAALAGWAFDLGRAALSWRGQGWGVTPRTIAVRRGYFWQTIVAMPRSKLQSVEVSQGPLLRRWGLSALTVRGAGAVVALPLLETAVAERLADELSGA